MIKHSTVFILGAGASMPYRFPSGAELRTHICAAALHDGNNIRHWLIHEVLKGKEKDLEQFGIAFLRSNMSSVDAFLNHRRDLLEVGKTVIAAVLTDFERRDPRVIFGDGLEDHWYRLLWNAMTFRAGGPDGLVSNRVSFITFNYDRSLEYFFHEAAKHTFGIDDDDAIRLVDRLAILHVYGQLGRYALKIADDGRPYSDEQTADALRIAAQGIHLIPEDRGDNTFALARNWLQVANRICFLGFGFDPLNIERLDLASVLETRRAASLGAASLDRPRIYASALNRTTAEREADQARCLGTAVSWSAYAMNNSMTLRQTNLLTPD